MAISLPHAAHGAAGRFLFARILLSRLLGRGIGERHDIARLHAGGQHHHGFTLLDELNFAGHESLVLILHEHNRFSVL